MTVCGSILANRAHNGNDNDWSTSKDENAYHSLTWKQAACILIKVGTVEGAGAKWIVAKRKTIIMVFLCSEFLIHVAFRTNAYFISKKECFL